MFTAILVVALWKFDVVPDVLKAIWGIIFPFVLGGAIAFMTNVPMSFLENKRTMDRPQKNSKSLAWSSVLKAFEKTEGKPVVSRPKALGDIRGVSYLYGIFYKFGLIDVPDDLLKKYQK